MPVSSCSRRVLLVGASLLGVTTRAAAQGSQATAALLLPGTEFYRAEVSTDPTGAWWVLHGTIARTVLDSMEVTVRVVPACGDEADDRPGGRTVELPEVAEPILLLRGIADLAGGSIRSAFLDDGVAGEAPEIVVSWNGQRLVVRHVTEDPAGDQPGRYRVELVLGGRRIQLAADEWQGDGQWRLRWVGDLNRDGGPDILVDASYKYSVYTTRLFLSRPDGAGMSFDEVATFTHLAC